MMLLLSVVSFPGLQDNWHTTCSRGRSGAFEEGGRGEWTKRGREGVATMWPAPTQLPQLLLLPFGAPALHSPHVMLLLSVVSFPGLRGKEGGARLRKIIEKGGCQHMVRRRPSAATMLGHLKGEWTR
jgi:hypothetical protein